MPEEQLIFISHSTKDKVVADAITHSLEARGLRCWIAPRDILPGKEYGSQIVEGIQRCSAMVLVLSRNSNLSRHIHSEIDRAFSFGKTIIPFRTEESLLDPALEYYLSNTHWLDAMTPPLEEHIDRLGDTLLGIVPTTHGANLITPPKKKIFLILASVLVMLGFVGIFLVVKMRGDITRLTPAQSVPSSVTLKSLTAPSPPKTDSNSTPDTSLAASSKSQNSPEAVLPLGTDTEPYLMLAQALAETLGAQGKIKVGVGNFLYEDTDLLSPYSSMLKDELTMNLVKTGKFEIISDERLADLQNNGKFQNKSIVEPGTEVSKIDNQGVKGVIRGRFYYQPPNLTIFAEIAWLDGGDVQKVKVIIPASAVAARIWPYDSQKQSQPEVAIAPQAVKESTASVHDVESKVQKVKKDFPLEIHTVDGKRGYAEGETISFRCRTGRDTFIAVVDHQIDGSDILLFPNAFNSDNYVAAGKTIDIPGTVKHGFEIQISPPFGSDVVQVIACTRKEDLEKITSTFPSSTHEKPYSVRTRGMKVVDMEEAQKNTSLESQPPQWSEDHIVVSTYPKVN